MKSLNLNIIPEEQMTEEQKRAYKFAALCFEKGAFTLLEVMQVLEENRILV